MKSLFSRETYTKKKFKPLWKLSYVSEWCNYAINQDFHIFFIFLKIWRLTYEIKFSVSALYIDVYTL